MGHEQCGYVFESENGDVVDKVLQIDLFRLLKTNEKGKFEFVGGILHALKHFSRNKINYSIGKGIHELGHPLQLIERIIHAFFFNPGIFENPNEYVILVPYDENHNLKFVFYREANTGVFFINTVYKSPKEKL